MFLQMIEIEDIKETEMPWNWLKNDVQFFFIFYTPAVVEVTPVKKQHHNNNNMIVIYLTT